MIKAVNMKNYKFSFPSAKGWYMFQGFGMIDTETNEFFSIDGRKPYVLTTKKYIQSCIDGGWVDTTLKRITLPTI